MRSVFALSLFAVAFLCFAQSTEAEPESGTLQIVARYVTGSPQRHTYMAMGEAIVFVEGQDAKLQADQIFYDDRTQLLEARGHVRVVREGKLVKESDEPLKFKADAPEYLLTETVTRISGPKIFLLAPEDIAR